jgi:hypothetical protein
MDSPRTVRRVSLTRRQAEDYQVVEAKKSTITEAEWNEFSGFTHSLKERLEKSFGKSINTFKTKIAGSTDPSFPRLEVVQQLKQTAMSMYTASEFIAKEVCDVADDSGLILFCFSIGVQALIQETLALLKIDLPQERIDGCILDVLEGVQSRKSTQVSFTDVDVEPYMRRLIVSFGIHSEFRPESPRTPGGANIASPPRPVASQLGAVTPPRPSPKPGPPPMTAASPPRPAPPPITTASAPRQAPPVTTGPSPPRPGTPPGAERLSPLRPIRGMANIDEERFLRALSSIGLNNRYRSYLEALIEVESASHATKAALVNFRQARMNQRFSQSQGF